MLDSNEINAINKLHNSAQTLNENATALLLSIREVQKALEAKYNAKHNIVFSGFGDEETEETKSIEALDCAYSHLSDAIENIRDCVLFIIQSK